MDLYVTNNGECKVSIEITYNSGIITNNAVELLLEEWRDGYQISNLQLHSEPVEGNRIRILEPSDIAGKDNQTFVISTTITDGYYQMNLSGTSEKAILYGICEILDQTYIRDQDVRLPLLNMISSPDVKKRGVERHWGPSMTTTDNLDENLKLIRLLARKRVNHLMWIDSWINLSWYPFLELRYFPALQRTDEQGKIKHAKECLRTIINEAKNWGMDFYLSCTEFNIPEDLLQRCPDMFYQNPQTGLRVLRLDHEDTWLFYKAKIKEVMEDFPSLSGIELWTGEAMEIYQCYRPDTDTRSIGELFLAMYDYALEAMDEVGRSDGRVICSSFTHHPDCEKIYEDILGKLPERCDSRSKMQVEDYYRFHSPATLPGRLSPGREWVEFDLGGEYRGDWAGWISCALAFIPDRMRYYYDKGISGFMCRIRGHALGPNTTFVGDYAVLKGLQSIKYDIYFKSCWDMNIQLADVWRMCKRSGFPDQMLEFFQLSEMVAEQAHYANEAIVNNFHSSFIGSIERYEWQLSYVDHVYNTAGLERKWILEPTEENLSLIVNEKEQAVHNVRRMSEILEQCKQELVEEDYLALRKCMDYQIQVVKVFKVHTEMFFRYRLFVMTKLEYRHKLLVDCMRRCEEEVKQLRLHDEVQAKHAYALISDIKWRLSCDMQKYYHELSYHGVCKVAD
ncbi:hypothetical protein [Paenibacillus borealis]|uniref:Beta-hexosaminidase bacterial type N-terminal domain-containing protein n=1 Tax=Paenibacillus borealis TaxID=160799 RepID=A0A089L8L8_PAEBO|nr:hypothetical protein [Paenibacillus borealis]AIQ57831.1 hypothetical protein PBOR_13490 [Paenibacillus borealis]